MRRVVGAAAVAIALAGCGSQAVPKGPTSDLPGRLADAIVRANAYDGVDLTWSVTTVDRGERRTVSCAEFAVEPHAVAQGERSEVTVWTAPVTSEGRCVGGTGTREVVIDGNTLWISTGKAVPGSYACPTGYRRYRAAGAVEDRLHTLPTPTWTKEALVKAIRTVSENDGTISAALDPTSGGLAATAPAGSATTGKPAPAATADAIDLDARLDTRGRLTDLTVTVRTGDLAVETRELFDKIGRPQGVASPDRRCLEPGVQPLTSTDELDQLTGFGGGS